MNRSPWLGVDTGVDPVRLARLLHRAHRLALRDGRPPEILRRLVARSWQRAVERGVDPDGQVPNLLSPDEAGRALASHPLAELVPMLSRLLSDAVAGSDYFAALSDSRGLLLWVDGPPKALESAQSSRFTPGHLCSESAVGTNAVGTALEISHSLQIFSAEHYNRRLQGLICSAAPIREPEEGRVLAALDLSGNFRSGHPHSLSLVDAIARVLESALYEKLRHRDDELRARFQELAYPAPAERCAILTGSGRVLAASPPGWLGRKLRRGADGSPLLPPGCEASDDPPAGFGEVLFVRGAPRRRPRSKPVLAIAVEDARRLRVSSGEWGATLSPRHSQILAHLALHPGGLRGQELRRAVYGPQARAATLRGEIYRLRALLGPVVEDRPYRLSAPVRCSRDEITGFLDRFRPGA